MAGKADSLAVYRGGRGSAVTGTCAGSCRSMAAVDGRIADAGSAANGGDPGRAGRAA